MLTSAAWGALKHWADETAASWNILISFLAKAVAYAFALLVDLLYIHGIVFAGVVLVIFIVSKSHTAVESLSL